MEPQKWLDICSCLICMPREEPGGSLLKRHLNAPWLKVPSSHGVGISTLWPDTWPQTLNIKTHDLEKQDHTADRQVSFTLLSLTLPLLSPSLLAPLFFFLLLSLLFCLPFIQLLTWKGPLIIEIGLNHPVRPSYSPLKSTGALHMDHLQIKMRTKEGFILTLLIYETDIHQHAKFRPKQGLLLHLLYLCSLLGNSCDSMPIATPNFRPCTNKHEEYTQ